MLRGLVLALLLANAVFFTWTHGGFSGVAAIPAPNPTEADREPQRLATQLRPEIIQLLPASPASAASAAGALASEAASASSPAASGASSASPT